MNEEHALLLVLLLTIRPFVTQKYGSAANTKDANQAESVNRDNCQLAREEHNCQFPEWAISMGPFYSFSFSSKYEFVDDGYVLSVSNYSTASMKSHELSRTFCISVREEDNQTVQLVTRVVAGCEEMYKCVRIMKRTENILEIQEGSPTSYEKAACTEQNFNEKYTIYTTLFREHLEKQPCPLNGIHNVTDLDLDGQFETCEKNGFTNINIKCGDQHVIQLYQKCPNEERMNRIEVTSSTEYHCVGGWEEQILFKDLPNPYLREGVGYAKSGLFVSHDRDQDEDIENFQNNKENITIAYVVAMRPHPRPNEQPKRICFIYSRSIRSGVGSLYSWTVDKTACLRNIRPGHKTRLRFNTTVLETCGASQFFSQRHIYWTVGVFLCASLTIL